jgi:hypothetical protein
MRPRLKSAAMPINEAFDQNMAEDKTCFTEMEQEVCKTQL